MEKNKTFNLLKIVILSLFLSSLFTNKIKAQAVVDPFLHPKFVNPLPTDLPVAQPLPGTTDKYKITMEPFTGDVGLVLPGPNTPLLTPMYGYNGMYPGPTIEAESNIPISVEWENILTGEHMLPVDNSIHWANPPGYPASGVPTVTHLHGGHTEPESDGYPEAWYTPSGVKGDYWVKDIYEYANTQEAATLWYHDHAVGITRLNNYAGLQGMYILRDNNEAALNLPSGDYEVPLIITDRTFLEDGKLFYPAFRGELYQPEPSIQLEFFGDFNLVNGKIWPVMEVEPRNYRFRVLNSADSRFYNLTLVEVGGDTIDFNQIGSDGGFLNSPRPKTDMLMGPAERSDIIVDFSGLPVGTEIIMHNDAAAPFPNGSPVDPGTQGVVMKFIVKAGTPDNFTLPTNLRPNLAPIPIPDTSAAVPRRQLILGISFDETGRLVSLMGTVPHGILGWQAPITENPQVNEAEIWEILNLTIDDHPMHIHQTQFQGVEIQQIDIDLFDMTGVISFTAPPIPVDNDWKDTFIVPSGFIARLNVKFDLPGLYVWHCHILSHEDNDMMRPLYIGDCDTAPSDLDFMECGPIQTGTVSGKVWEDTNGNGIQDLGEPGIINASVELITAAALLFEQVKFTDADGNYEFTDIPTGSHHLVFGNPGGYFSTIRNQGIDPTKDSDIWYSGQTEILYFASGEVKTNMDGGFVPEMGLPPILDPIPHPKFVNPLPIMPTIQPTSSPNNYEVNIVEFTADLGVVDPDSNSITTTMYGYNGMYPGPTFEVNANVETTIKWINDLPTGADGAHILPLDETIHWANPTNYPTSGVPIVTHVHGGHTEAKYDGYPDAWYTPGASPDEGDFSVGDDYVYANTQDPMTLWYHDHTIGMTRLNINAGLEGFYLIRNDWEDNLNLPSGDYEIPLMLADRSFREDGELYFPSYPAEQWNPNVSIIEEFFGDFNLVNGKVWPFLEVEPRKYRFRVLNGSDSRFYNVQFDNGLEMIQIGSDGGFLNDTLHKTQILLGPAERADIIIDFSNYAGSEFLMTNDANSPFPFGTPPDPGTAGSIMQFKVLSTGGTDNSVIPELLRPSPIDTIPIDSTSPVRQLVLIAGSDKYGRLRPMMGTRDYGIMPWVAPISETPQVNVPEVWEIINLSPDSHPIHLHQVPFQALEMQRFDDAYFDVFQEFIFIGPPVPLPLEWKDTYVVPPGFVLRVAVNFDLEGLYVWHCHILSHEDFDMMRPMYIGDCQNPVSEYPIEFMDCAGTEEMGSLNGVVWDDTNADGIRDPGEEGIGNDLIEVFDYLGSFIANDLTDDNGEYNIEVPPGMYTVAFGSPGAYYASPENVGNDTTDSDMLFSLNVLPFIAVASGQDIYHIDGGFTPQDRVCELAATYDSVCNGDGTWSVELTVTGTGAQGWSSQNSAFNGEFNTTYTFGTYPFSGNSVVLILVDNEDVFCATTVTVPTPFDECGLSCAASIDVQSDSIIVSGIDPYYETHINILDTTGALVLVFDCNPYDLCESPQVIPNLATDEYLIAVQTYDEDGTLICNLLELADVVDGIPVSNIAIGDATVDENDGVATLTLTASPAPTADITVNYTSYGISAYAPYDYYYVSGVATIAAGSNSTTIDIPLVDDAVAEAIEEFRVELSNPTNAIITDFTGVVTILDDESSCNVVISASPNTITVTGLNDPDVTFYVFNASYGVEFSCTPNGSTCNSTEVVGGLTPGPNYVFIQTFTADGTMNCFFFETIMVPAPSINQPPKGTSNQIGLAMGNILVYPNPTKGKINLITSGLREQIGTIEIFDVLGRNVFHQANHAFTDNPFSISLAGQTSGVYFLTITTENQEKYIHRIILSEL